VLPATVIKRDTYTSMTLELTGGCTSSKLPKTESLIWIAQQQQSATRHEEIATSSCFVRSLKRTCTLFKLTPRARKSELAVRRENNVRNKVSMAVVGRTEEM
jgi:hypothetical protein